MLAGGDDGVRASLGPLVGSKPLGHGEEDLQVGPSIDQLKREGLTHDL